MEYAIKILKESGLPKEKMEDYYEMYVDECEETSEHHALELLETQISDWKEEND